MLQVKMKYLLIALPMLFPLSLSAQTSNRNVMKEIYEDALHPSDPLMNGREYKYYFNPRISSPLIPKDHAPTATVTIRNRLMEDVTLLYDTYKDQVVYYNPGDIYKHGIASLVVNSHLIEEFTLELASGPARFRYFSFPEDQEGGISSGFYELVNEGDCMFIIDHKAIQKIQDGAVIYKYTPRRYIINSAAAFRNTGKRSLLKALSDKNEEIKEYLKQSNIRVKAADKEQIRAVVDYYTDLKYK